MSSAGYGPTSINTAEKSIRKVSFFAFMRRIQAETGAQVGCDTKPNEEPIRLKAEPSLAYPASELTNITADDASPDELEVAFLGLFGPNGALPLHYTQLVIDRSRHKDNALRDFLNIFNHRWLSLFYRAWEKTHYASAFETSRRLGKEDPITRAL